MTVASLLAPLVGLGLGSFLNVVITRLPQEGSVGAGGARCLHCRGPRPWYDHIPLFSYLWGRGRCRACGAAIPWRYPLVELAGGLLALALWRTFPDKLLLLAYGPFCLALVALTAIDLEHRLLPDAITIPGTILGLLLSLVLPHLSFREAAAGALVGAGFLYGVGRFHEKLSGRRGLGLSLRGRKTAAPSGGRRIKVFEPGRWRKRQIPSAPFTPPTCQWLNFQDQK